MTEQEAIVKLKDLHSDDNEIVHCIVDDVLIEYLLTTDQASVAQAWLDAREKCGGFWYA